jgi:transcriptional regulator with XRE-family HTH domain
MDISENIRKLRESKGYTQSKLADILQMERGNYHRLENRGNKMTIEQLQGIADALGVSVGPTKGR